MRVDFVRLCAPSRQSWAAKGVNNAIKKGHRPLERVMVATDANGVDWVHDYIFAASEGQKAAELVKQVERVGQINAAHWRKAEKSEY